MFTDDHLAIRFDETLARSSTAEFQELEHVVAARSPASCADGEAKQVATVIWAGCTGRPCWPPGASSPSVACAMKGEPRQRARQSPDS
jgi:hypothetical protein